jgi:hypothetical protein
MDRKYRIEIQQYQQNYNVISQCNNITFINNGAINVQINQFTLVPNASLSIGGNENEIDITVYNVSFQGATNGNLIVIKKIFA